MSSRADEEAGTDPEWTVGQVRRALIEQDLNAKVAELALLMEQAGFPHGNFYSRVPRQVPTIVESDNSPPGTPSPVLSPESAELRSNGETLSPTRSEDADETLELEAVEPPPPARKRRTRAGSLLTREPARSATETVAPEAVLAEEGAAVEPTGPVEVVPQPVGAMPAAEATGLTPGATEAQVGMATGGSEVSVEPLIVSADQAESLYDAQQPRRRTVAVLTGGGLLILVLVGAFLVWTGSLAVAPGSALGLDSSGGALILMVPPIGAEDPRAEAASAALGPLPAAAAGVESSGERGLEPEPVSIAAPERESGSVTIAGPVGELPPARVTATVDAEGFGGVNLRRAPTTSAAAIEILPSGTRVELLDGQAQDDGFGWQQVLAPDGETGWVVAGTVQR